MTSSEPQKLSSKRARPHRSPTGRLIVYLTFGLLALYGTSAVVGSVARDLYGRPPPEARGELSTAERTWCVRRLVGLRNELEARVAFEVRVTAKEKLKGDPIAEWSAFNEKWAREYQAASQRCRGHQQTLTQAYERLHAMHQHYASGTGKIMQARTQLVPPIDEAVQRLLPRR